VENASIVKGDVRFNPLIKVKNDLDYHLIDAQETLRVLDGLFGYLLSPVLWKKAMPSISAGRVQSFATRLIVEKEREHRAFVSSFWWDLAAVTALGLNARLLEVDGKKVAASSNFGVDAAVKEMSLANILLGVKLLARKHKKVAAG